MRSLVNRAARVAPLKLIRHEKEVRAALDETKRSSARHFHRMEAAMIKLAVLWFAFFATPAMATLTAMTPEVCAAGEYLIGVSGRSGDWIDAIRPVCASWNPATRTAGAPRNGPTHGGRGGGEGVAVCPRGSAVSGWEIRHVTRGDTVFLQYVAPQCRTILPPREIVEIGRLQFGRGNPPMPSSGPTFHGCGKRELAIGLSVAVGENHVGGVDLKCRFVPNVSPPMASRDTGRGTRLYMRPTIRTASGDDVSLDICREWATNCGAPAAVAFCRTQNYATAVAFEPATGVGLTAVISNGRICSDPSCGGFASIECGAVSAAGTTLPTRPPPVLSTTPSSPVSPQAPPSATAGRQTPLSELKGTLYRDPEIAADNSEMVRLDWCREWGSACGKPAADAYCQALGHARSGQIQIRNNIGKTAIISSKAICSDPACSGFRLIECVN